MTFAEFEQLPYPEPGKMELVNGEVIAVPPPQKTHQDIAARIQRILCQHFDWMRVRMDHNGYRIGDNWLEPDVSVTWPEQRVDEGDYFRDAPMIAVEILSPGEEIDEKLANYLAHGAREVLVVNPRKKTMSAYVSRGDSVVFQQVTDEFHSEAAGGLAIRLRDIFE